MDDDPAVRRSLGRALRTAGYAVQPAEHGAEALRKIAEQDYAVVICDLMMPVMDGIRLYQVLAERHPDTAGRTLFITGWAHDARIQRFLKGTDRPTLLKPFEITDFLSVVGSVARGADLSAGSASTDAPAGPADPISYTSDEIALIHDMIVTPGSEVACPRCGDALAMSAPQGADPAVTELRCGRCQRVMIVRDFEGEG